SLVSISWQSRKKSSASANNKGSTSESPRMSSAPGRHSSRRCVRRNRCLVERSLERPANRMAVWETRGPAFLFRHELRTGVKNSIQSQCPRVKDELNMDLALCGLKIYAVRLAKGARYESELVGLFEQFIGV